MTNIAILIGNTEYRALNPLPCCASDVEALRELIEATGKFQSVEKILNHGSSALKDRLRQLIDAHSGIGEIFFYFTGHGYQNEADFFFCAQDFDSRRPNDTGLSNEELHTLLRSANAELIVKVIDACSSGALLLKADDAFISTTKHGFKHFIQIASCLDSQSSLAGEPLSLFTEKFVSAVLRKTQGTVYYTDVVNALRDEFIDNNSQTPHFVSQGTSREFFTDNAHCLDSIRLRLNPPAPDLNPLPHTALEIAARPTSLIILERAEKNFATKERADSVISRFFDELLEEARNNAAFSDFFEFAVETHDDFAEPTTRSFIIRVLKGEKRPDNFVTAENRRRDPFNIASYAAAILSGPDESVAHYDLSLNCSLEKVQLKITLTPKYISLRKFVLVVTCAPSLENCYIFEMLTKHSLADWQEFDLEGSEVVRRWYKKRWTDGCAGVAKMIVAKLHEVIQEDIEATRTALEGDS